MDVEILKMSSSEIRWKVNDSDSSAYCYFYNY